MKKFIVLAFAAILTAFTISSCKEQSFALTYDFSVTGRANGNVDLTFPGGSLDLVGDAEVNFDYGNDTTKFTANYVTLEELKESGDSDELKAARLIEKAFDEEFTATTAGGTYYLHVLGTVKETLTGVEVKIDKILTNEDPSVSNER